MKEPPSRWNERKANAWKPHWHADFAWSKWRKRKPKRARARKVSGKPVLPESENELF